MDSCLVEFPGEDSDTRSPVGCSISEAALADHFGGDRGDASNLLGAFRRYRAVIERSASKTYDAEGKPELVILRSADIQTTTGPSAPTPQPGERRSRPGH